MGQDVWTVAREVDRVPGEPLRGSYEEAVDGLTSRCVLCPSDLFGGVIDIFYFT